MGGNVIADPKREHGGVVRKDVTPSFPCGFIVGNRESTAEKISRVGYAQGALLSPSIRVPTPNSSVICVSMGMQWILLHFSKWWFSQPFPGNS